MKGMLYLFVCHTKDYCYHCETRKYKTVADLSIAGINLILIKVCIKIYGIVQLTLNFLPRKIMHYVFKVASYKYYNYNKHISETAKNKKN